MEYDVNSKAYTTLKVTPVPNYAARAKLRRPCQTTPNHGR